MIKKIILRILSFLLVLGYMPTSLSMLSKSSSLSGSDADDLELSSFSSPKKITSEDELNKLTRKLSSSTQSSSDSRVSDSTSSLEEQLSGSELGKRPLSKNLTISLLLNKLNLSQKEFQSMLDNGSNVLKDVHTSRREKMEQLLKLNALQKASGQKPEPLKSNLRTKREKKKLKHLTHRLEKEKRESVSLQHKTEKLQKQLDEIKDEKHKSEQAKKEKELQELKSELKKFKKQSKREKRKIQDLEKEKNELEHKYETLETKFDLQTVKSDTLERTLLDALTDKDKTTWKDIIKHVVNTTVSGSGGALLAVLIKSAMGSNSSSSSTNSTNAPL